MSCPRHVNGAPWIGCHFCQQARAERAEAEEARLLPVVVAVAAAWSQIDNNLAGVNIRALRAALLDSGFIATDDEAPP